MKSKFFKSVMLLLVLCSLLASPCSGVEKASVVRMSATLGFGSATLHIMRELRLLEKHLPENVAVKWSSIASAPDTRDAMAAGAIDIAELSTATFMVAVENGLPLVLLSNCGMSVANLYSNRPDIKSLQDFSASDKIAVMNRATTHHYIFMAKCKQVFGDYMALDTAVIGVPQPDVVVSLESGAKDLDGAVLGFPYTIKANKIKNLTLISDLSSTAKEYGVSSSCVTTESFFDNNPELIEAFLKAQRDVIDFTAKEPDKAAELLAKLYQVDAPDCLEALRIMPLTNAITGYDKQSELLYEAGILSKKPRPLSELKNYKNLVIAN